MQEIANLFPPKTFKYIENWSQAELEKVVLGLPQEAHDIVLQAAHLKTIPDCVVPTAHFTDMTEASCEDDPFLQPVSDECRHACIAQIH
jgi:hypothetical protein